MTTFIILPASIILLSLLLFSSRGWNVHIPGTLDHEHHWMKKFFTKHKAAVLQGAAITVSIYAILVVTELAFMEIEGISALLSFLITAITLIGCWAVAACAIHLYSLKKILLVIGILLSAVLVDNYVPTDYNPITVPLIIIFWIGVAYLVIPDFFKKYQTVILSVYGMVISYYLISFVTTSDSALAHREGFAQFLLFPLPVLAALWIYEQWRWLKNLQADKTRVELSLLKNQLNPHFFFNTLNNLYGLAVEKSDEAPAMILKLSDMMRYTIYDGEAEYVPLADEVAYLDNYIDLHKIRYRQRGVITYDKAINHQHQIAPLLLIVPLENAFKHGMERQVEGAYIELSVATTPSSICCKIRNNYTPNEAHTPGIGLDNLKKRLALIYPKRHTLEIIKESTTYSVNLEILLDEVPDH